MGEASETGHKDAAWGGVGYGDQGQVGDDVRVEIEVALEFIEELGADVELINDARGVFRFSDEAFASREDFGDAEGKVDQRG